MYNEIIESAAKEYRVDPRLIRAIITVESNWNPFAFRHEPQISDTSWGLMQVLLSTGRRISGNSSLTSKQLAQPTVNILIGTKYLRELFTRYKGNLTDVIAAYNAGSAIRSHLDVTKYVNQNYVDKVLRVYQGTQFGLVTFPLVGVLLLIAVVGSSRK